MTIAKLVLGALLALCGSSLLSFAGYPYGAGGGSATTTTPTPTPPPFSATAHVFTVAQCCGGSDNDTPVPSTALPLIDFFHNSATNAVPQGNMPSALASYGAHNISTYIDLGRVAPGDFSYSAMNGGSLASARALNCSLAVINAGGGTFISSPFSATTVTAYQQNIAWFYSGNGGGEGDKNYNWIFADDVDSYANGVTNGPPCNLGSPWASTNVDTAFATMLDAVVVPSPGPGQTAQPRFAINTLGVIQGGTAAINALQASAHSLVFMCEGCFYNGSLIGGASWVASINAQIATQNNGKAFWDLEQDSTTVTATAIAHRNYYFASLMLDWAQTTTPTNPTNGTWFSLFAMFGHGNGAGNPALHYMPEWGFTAYQPLLASVTDASQMLSGSVYYREYNSCQLWDSIVGHAPVNVGHCVAVVNPTGSPQTTPTFTNTYTQTLTLSGKAIFEGGTATLAAGAPSGTIPGMTGIIFTQ